MTTPLPRDSGEFQQTADIILSGACLAPIRMAHEVAVSPDVILDQIPRHVKVEDDLGEAIANFLGTQNLRHVANDTHLALPPGMRGVRSQDHTLMRTKSLTVAQEGFDPYAFYVQWRRISQDNWYEEIVAEPLTHINTRPAAVVMAWGSNRQNFHPFTAMTHSNGNYADYQKFLATLTQVVGAFAKS